MFNLENCITLARSNVLLDIGIFRYLGMLFYGDLGDSNEPHPARKNAKGCGGVVSSQ